MHQSAADVQHVLAEVADALDTLIDEEPSRLRDGLVNARTVLRAAIDKRSERPTLGMAVRLLRQVEAEAAATHLAEDAQRLSERLIDLIRQAAKE